MKFPKSSVLLCCFSLIFFSCKKEVNEKKSLQIIQNVVLEKKITKEKFNSEVLPEIKSLYEKDSVKYRILNHIAKKASIEKNPKIFSIQLNDMKSEMEFIK
jgi:ribosomal protein L3